jgi:hypothetical protein
MFDVPHVGKGNNSIKSSRMFTEEVKDRGGKFKRKPRVLLMFRA